MRTAGQALEYLGKFVPIANRIGIDFFEQPTAQIYWITLDLKLKVYIDIMSIYISENTYININDYTAGGGNKPTLMYILYNM